MGLNRKTELVFLCTAMVLVGLAYGIQQRVVMESFNQLEQTQARRDMDRCLDAIQREIDGVQARTADWACWDDVYQFIQDGNENFVGSNLVNDALHEITKVDFGAFLTDEGKVVWQSAKDRNTGEHVQLAEFPSDAWPKDHPLFPVEADKPFSGIILTSHGPMIIAVSKVTNAAKTAPPRGLLVMGNFFNDTTIQALVRQTHVEFIAWPAIPEAVPPEDAVMLTRLTMGESIIREHSSSDLLDVYRAYPGPRNEPVLLVRAHIPRDIGMRGQKAVHLSMAFQVAVSVGFLLILGVFLHWTVLTPIATLTRHVTHIGRAGNLSLRVDNDHRDEIGVLAQEFNSMMDRIESSHHELQMLTEELEQLSRHDALTGLYNRRYFDEVLDREIRRSARTGLAVSLIMVDVDYFKKYNDHYGHVQGDEVLRRVASVLMSCARRAADSAARYGGEEFVIILPNTAVDKAEQVARKVCESVARLELPHLGSTVASYVTVSLGVAGLVADRDTHPEELIAAADTALYQAKHKGRNRVISAAS